MEIFLDCLPCMLKQVLEASGMATDKKEIRERIIIDSIKILSNYRQFPCSPELAPEMHNTVKTHTQSLDPYEKIKTRDVKSALSVYPFLKQFLVQKKDSLYWALKISATGNIIDSAINSKIDIESCVKTELLKDFGLCDINSFERKLEKARNLLIVGDNSGETVFDRVLAEHLHKNGVNIFYAVRNSPILNDATIKEAYDSGLDGCTTIVTTGCGAPGAVIDKCDKNFVDLFYKSDIIISKGQGNYEALSECDRSVFFLLKAKCPVIAKKIGVALNDYVFLKIEK